jgi:beta-alanine--pyruvate transaminase
MAPMKTQIPETLEHYWMPFTDNPRFKAAPKFIVSAKDMYYTTSEGRRILDGLATLWCINAGHCRPRIVEAIRRQAGELDFAASFSTGHPLAFELAGRIAGLAPPGLSHVFFTNSGSEAVDTVLKIAIAYHRLRGEASRTKFIGRERAYHGVNIAGLSVSGVSANRKVYAGTLLGNVDHLRHTHDLERRAFTRGCAAEGGPELADELEQRIIPLHDSTNIAAVIVEPVAGAGGVLVPPKGYLQRLREICTRHGILLIFDEVICGFGRLGTPFGAQYFGVEPDMITFAKGVTSGSVPLGGVIVKKQIYDTFMASGAGVQFFHGYTYSGHPLAMAAGLGALDTYAEEKLFDRSNELGRAFEDGIHSMKGLPNVIDCRNLQLIGAIELAPRPGAPGARGFELFEKCWAKGVFVRPIGDVAAICPPLICEKQHLETIFSTVADQLKTIV